MQPFLSQLLKKKSKTDIKKKQQFYFYIQSVTVEIQLSTQFTLLFLILPQFSIFNLVKSF